MTKPVKVIPFWKKCLKVSLITLASVILFISIAIAIAINFIFSSEKITPLVLDQASAYLNAEVTCNEVDLTFFSTFPEFGLRLEEGNIVSNVFRKDTIYQPQDSLISFKTALVTINPIAFLVKNQIKINRVLFDQASVYAFVDETGKPNWDIALLPESEMAADTAVSDTSSFDAAVEIGSIEFKKTNLIFDDRQTRMYGNVKDLDLTVDGSLSLVENDLGIRMSTANLLFWQEGNVVVNNLACDIDTRLHVNRATHRYDLDKTVVDINGVKIGAAGTFYADTLQHTLDVDIQFGLRVPSLKTVLDLIPNSLVKEATDVKADGTVKVDGSLKGVYGKEVMPVLDFSAVIENGKAQYKGMKYGVDQLDLNMTSRIDLQHKENSFVRIDKFIFKGASSMVSLNATVADPLTSPVVNSDIESVVNFTELSETFPLAEGVKMGGSIEAKLQSVIRMADIERKDWGKLDLNGYLKSTDMFLDSPADSFYVELKEAGLGFGTNLKDNTILQGKNLLNAVIGFDGLKVDSKKGSAAIDKMSLHLKTSPLLDTTAIASVQATFGFARMDVKAADTLEFRSGASKASIALGPSPKEKLNPRFISELKFDSLYVRAGSHWADLKNAGFSLQTKKGTISKKHWISTGSIGFYSFDAYSSLFPLDIHMPSSKITLEEDRIVLDRASVSVGHSDMTLTGYLENLTNVFFKEGTLFGKLTVQSKFVDCNELIKASAGIPETTTEKSDTTTLKGMESEGTNDSIGVFVVPAKIDFTLQTDINRVKFGNMEITNILGDMVIRNQSIELSELKLHTLAADMVTTMVYKATDNKSAYTGFDLNMKDIQVGKLVEAMPALDTLVPMLRSLEGKVNFRVAAETNLDREMMPVIPSIHAAAKVRGDSLVLMDGETFSEISKMLRFKNKDRNVIDSVSVDLLVTKGQIEIFPFLIRMDRYLAAVGGKHNIDMTFDYHVSLLDSPIPFKVGVDVKGNMDDFKFKICRPKFKDLTKSSRTSPVDSTGVSVRDRIRKTIQRIEKE